MSKPSNQYDRFVLVGLALLTTCSSVFAQSPTASEKAVPTSKVLAAEACEAVVRPIRRVKKPAKSASVDWTTMASTYSHDSSGQRVDQYAQTVEPLSMERPDFVRSGYRHTRSTLQAGFSADHYHQTESWGQPVRPYGEWRYPNRPFSVPYGQWGPQLPQVLAGGNQFNAISPWGMKPGPQPKALGNNAAAMNGGAANNGAFANGPNHGSPWATPGWWGYGPGFGYGQGYDMGQGLGVGPQNVLPAGQDEYYPPAPIYHPMPDEGFQSPFRN